MSNEDDPSPQSWSWPETACGAAVFIAVLWIVTLTVSPENSVRLMNAGEAVGFASGLFAAGAFVVATFQIRLQREANQKQTEMLEEQKRALALQLDRQYHADLRNAYAPFLRAASDYLDYISESLLALHRECDRGDDAGVDAYAQRLDRDAGPFHDAIRSHLPMLELLDNDDERARMRWTVRAEFRLRSYTHTVEDQRDQLLVCQAELELGVLAFSALKDSIRGEFAFRQAPGHAIAKRIVLAKVRTPPEDLAAAQERIRVRVTSALKPT